jgi:type II secretion system protein J
MIREYRVIKGFTLLEIIVSLFVLTIIGVIISTGLHIVVKMQQRMEDKITQLGDIQLAMMILENDIRQIINRPIWDENGEERAALVISDTKLEFTHSGYLNPLSSQRSTLQRVAYYLQGTDLMRVTWPILDRVADTKPGNEVLLNNVMLLHMHVIPANNILINVPSIYNYNFLTQRNSKNKLNTQYIYQDIAIKIEINIAGIGYIERVFPIAANVFAVIANVAA